MQPTVWARNLRNDKYVVRSFADIYGPLVYAMGFPGDARTVGVEVTYRFR